MFKYVLKRIGYMFLVLFILSIVIFMIYNLTPSNRAYTDAKADQVAMKQQLAGMSAEAQAKWFEGTVRNVSDQLRHRNQQHDPPLSALGRPVSLCG